MNRRLEGELRELLATYAASVPAERDPYGRTVRSIRRARRRRSFTVALCACLLAAVAVPLAVLRPGSTSSPMAWPPRGVLADDSGFRAAVRERARAWLELRQPELRVRSSRVVYAGESAQRRRAVVALSVSANEQSPAEPARMAGSGRAGTPRNYIRLALLSGPPGAAPQGLRYRMSALFLPGSSPAASERAPRPTLRDFESRAGRAVRAPVPAVAWLEPGGQGGAQLFAVGPPETQAMAYSPGVAFHPDGTWDRSWQRLRARTGQPGVARRTVADPQAATDLLRLDLPRGVVAVPVGTRQAQPGPATELASGTAQDRSRLGSVGSAGELGHSGDREGLAAALAALRRQTGGTADEVQTHARWRSAPSGRDRQYPHRRGRPGRLLAASLSSGATFQVVSLSPRDHHVVLVPRGQGDRPVAVVEPDQRPEPDGDGGSAENPAGKSGKKNPGGAGGPAAGAEQNSGEGPGLNPRDGEAEDAGAYSEQDSEELGNPTQPCPDFGEDPESWGDDDHGRLTGDEMEPVRRIVTVVPGHTDGYAQLWLRGEKLATAPVDETERAIFDSHVVGCLTSHQTGNDAAGGEYGVSDLRVRVIDGSGRRIYRGPVHDAGAPPPWNRLGEPPG